MCISIFIEFCVLTGGSTRLSRPCAQGYKGTVLAGGRDPPVCWCPRGGVPPCGPPAVLCAPLWWARAQCADPPLRWVLAPCASAPPRYCGPDLDHCYDRREAAALDAFVRSLLGDQGSDHPHAYGSCVRRARTAHAVIHSPQQAFSQQSSGAAASRRRSHSSATNTRSMGSVGTARQGDTGGGLNLNGFRLFGRYIYTFTYI